MGAAWSSRRRGACLALALGALLAGCGTKGTVQGGNNAFSATTLTVFSDLPLLGPDRAQATSIFNGEVLALYDAGGHVGKLHVSIASLNDAAEVPLTGASHTTQTARSARAASTDLSTVAYIGDLDSAATALSLPLNNENDILQVSPGSSYVGFTDASPVNYTGDPRRYYPNGYRTFARLVPSDLAEARAAVTYMRSIGVQRLVVLAARSSPPYGDAAIAPLVAAAAPAGGITVASRLAGIDTQQANPKALDYARIANAVAAQHPDAVLLGATPDPGAQALWQELHAKLPRARLFAPSTLATPTFLRGLGAASAATYVTSPILEAAQYPPAAQHVFAEYRRAFPGDAPTPYVLYGYDAMKAVLWTIGNAHPRNPGDLRPALANTFFHRGVIHGTLGDYTINANGDTSLTSFDGYRVGAGGQLVLVRRIS
jgi:branched-chain amino acid transport system substrate-binding protein